MTYHHTSVMSVPDSPGSRHPYAITSTPVRVLSRRQRQRQRALDLEAQAFPSSIETPSSLALALLSVDSLTSQQRVDGWRKAEMQNSTVAAWREEVEDWNRSQRQKGKDVVEDESYEIVDEGEVADGLRKLMEDSDGELD